MKKEIKILKDLLAGAEKRNVSFIVKGLISYRKTTPFDLNCPELIELAKNVENDGWGDIPTIFTFYKFGDDENEYALRDEHSSMNLEKFSSKYMWFYSFDTLKIKTKSKLRYEDIIILTD